MRRAGVSSSGVWAEAVLSVHRGRHCLICCSLHGPRTLSNLSVPSGARFGEREPFGRCRLYRAAGGGMFAHDAGKAEGSGNF
ncbi:hypothetical protein NDU88_004863 [Pleurodeles waltl]|uniref:Uncharacterized protein n=1 Tax=Pleurodeles waltl TaxID=8319 RepID=A0AAV7NPS9_PLEWA|nr:hypothetical protein NDU88_004863 [Pleurodeles waltl]